MRLVLLLLSLLLATSASAEWVKVVESADTVSYVDPATIRDAGGVRRASVLQDYPQQEPGGIRSRRVSFEFDCRGERMRRLSVTEHSERMGEGKILAASDAASDWSYVGQRTGSHLPPRTPPAQILSFVCSR